MAIPPRSAEYVPTARILPDWETELPKRSPVAPSCAVIFSPCRKEREKMRRGRLIKQGWWVVSTSLQVDRIQKRKKVDNFITVNRSIKNRYLLSTFDSFKNKGKII